MSKVDGKKTLTNREVAQLLLLSGASPYLSCICDMVEQVADLALLEEEVELATKAFDLLCVLREQIDHRMLSYKEKMNDGS